MIYGIDVSMRRVAVACPSWERAAAFGLPPKVPHSEAMVAIGDYVASMIPKDSIVYVEAPVVAGARNLQSTIKAAMTCGAVIGRLGHATVHVIAVDTWKKAVCGLGGIDKAAVRDWLYASSEVLAEACHDDQDRIDATCIALAGHLGARGALPG